jgi:hypothetical protein
MAKKKITDFAAVGSVNDAGLVLPVVDTLDTTMDATGTNKKLNLSDLTANTLTAEQQATLSHFIFNPATDKLEADRAIETTLNSLFLGEQHKMSSGSENIFFTNLTSDINFFPMWGGLKDQSITANQGSSGFIPPSGRVYTDMFSLPLGGSPDPLNAMGYAGDNYFGVNITGLGITTVAAEEVDDTVRLEYRIEISGKNVYKQHLPRDAARSTAASHIYAGDVIEWYFDHPVDVRAGTTLYAEIMKVDIATDADLGVFQVQRGDTVDPNTGLYRYQATVHNRLFEDKDLELISPYLKYKAADFVLDDTGSNVYLRDLSLGAENLLAPYDVNLLEAVANGTEIKIKVKGGAKIIIESLPVNAITIDGTYVNSVMNQAVVQLNDLFTNTQSFVNTDAFVNSFVLSGTNLVLGLNDGTSYTADISNLGVDENNFVASGVVSGTDLILTMDDASTVTIDASNMVNGANLSAVDNQWFISYGANANNLVSSGTTNHVSGGVNLNTQGPYYFGQQLTRGSEFKFNMSTATQWRLGIWDGVEAPFAYNAGQTEVTNYSTVFSFLNGSSSFIDSTNTDVASYQAGSTYVVANGAPLVLRFDNAGHLTLLDLTGGVEAIIGKTTSSLADAAITLQFGAWTGGVFPNGTISSSLWTVVHDFDDSEAGLLNGIEDHTVLQSNISIEIGEKIMFMLDEVGQGDFFGTNYSNAASGVTTAEEQLDNTFIYQTNEAIVMTFNGVSDWDANTSANGYFNSAGLDQYRHGGGAGTVQGLFSLRFNDSGKLTIYDEDANQKVATAKVDPTIGSSVYLYFGVKGNRAYYSIPVISKQTIGQGTQPIVDAAPTAADQTVTINEGSVMAYQIVTSDNIVNQFYESDAPSWLTLNQNSGILSGTAPAFTGTAADTIVVNCVAGNAVGGRVFFTVTITVAEVAYTNTNSLSFDGSTTFMQGNPVNMDALDRATNGDGNSWTISMWVKPNSGTGNQTLMVYGAGDDYNGGAITLKQSGGTTLVLNYGTVYDNIILVAANCFVANTWQHVLITFDGGTTGSDPLSTAAYYSRFDIYIDGVLKSNIGVATGGGYDGAISGENTSDNIFRIGRASNVHNNYFGGVINQIAIWDTDQTANISTIYNSGSTHDLTLLGDAPTHYYEIGTSITTIADLGGSAPLTGYNFSNSDLVTDTP